MKCLFSHVSHDSIFDTHATKCLEIWFDVYIRDSYATDIAVFCLSSTAGSGKSHFW